MLARLLCDAEITGIIVDGAGQPTRLGRTRRSVSAAQWAALVARDRGCVICDAAPSRCEAHHLVPWLELGRTDLDNLVLVCTRHHHQLHDHHLHLTRDGTHWTLHEPTAIPP